MSRLTKKNNQGTGSWTQFGDAYIPAHNIKHKQCVNKLGKLEDLEDELGCPLDVVFNALVDGILINDKKWWLPRVNLIYMIVDDEYVFICEKYSYKLKDYKKTWWLKEDKSE